MNKIEINTYKGVKLYFIMFFCEKCHHLLNIKKNAENSTDTGYFFCESCGNTEPIKNTTLIYQSIKEDINEGKTIEPELCVLDIHQRKILPKCSNKKCTTKDKTEVIIAKDGNFNVSYVCMTCHTAQ
jgi:DNA-directed RNA polymerase subunit M/transcription elongation factor TFIIS